jgi:hypothetical protein
LKLGDKNSNVSPRIGLNGLFNLRSEHLYYAIENADTRSIRIIGLSLFSIEAALTNRDSYSIISATFCTIDIGSLKYTGTQNLDKSLPTASLITFQILTF